MALAPTGEAREHEDKGAKSKVRCCCLFLACGTRFVPQEESRYLEFALWLVAWDRYALAAQVVEHQLDYRVSLLHREVVVNVACSASAGGRSELLGVLYDELARWICVGGSAARGCFARVKEKVGRPSCRQAGQGL